MATINVDIEKVREFGKDIENISFDFITLINDFYERINKIPEGTREWIGEEANQYVKLCLTEKANYIKLGNSLKELGKTLIDYSDKMNSRKKSVEVDIYDEN